MNRVSFLAVTRVTLSVDVPMNAFLCLHVQCPNLNWKRMKRHRQIKCYFNLSNVEILKLKLRVQVALTKPAGKEIHSETW